LSAFTTPPRTSNISTAAKAASAWGEKLWALPTTSKKD
jgi:hypothetical protein